MWPLRSGYSQEETFHERSLALLIIDFAPSYPGSQSDKVLSGLLGKCLCQFNAAALCLRSVSL